MSEIAVVAGIAVLGASVRWLPVFAAAAVSARALKRRPARERHLLWFGALLILALLPFAAGRLPVAPIPLPTLPGQARETLRAERPSAGAAEVAATPGTLERSHDERGLPESAEALAADASAPAREAAGRSGGRGPAVLLAAAWAAGALILFGFELLAIIAAGELTRSARAVEANALPATVHDRKVQLDVLAGATDVPMLLGLLRSRVVLPAEWRAWPESWVRAALLHEFAHADRHDLVVLAWARLIRVVFWFHPAVWFCVRALRQEAENAADERVLRSGLDPFEYADALLGIARGLGRRVLPLAGLPLASAPALRRRLLRLVTARPPATASPLPLTGAAVTIVCVALAAAAPAARALPVQWLSRTELAAGGVLWQSICPASDAECARLTDAAARLLGGLPGGGAIAVQEASTGRILAYAFVDRAGSAPAVPAVPIASVAGIPLAAAWWEAQMDDRALPCPAVINLVSSGAFSNTNGLDTGHIRVPGDVLALQCATAAIAMGWYLAEQHGTSYLQQAFARWGFAAHTAGFWPSAIVPEPAVPLAPEHPAAENVNWIIAGSAHSTVRTTPLHLTRFLQAIATGGRMITPVPPSAVAAGGSSAFIDAATADRLLGLLLRQDDPTGAEPDPARLVGMRGRTPSAADGAEESDVFAGFATDDAGRPRMAVAVWTPGATPHAGPHPDARAIAARLLTHLD